MGKAMGDAQKTGLNALHNEVSKCSRCGYCQSSCPVYAATGREGRVARGRIALVKSLI